MKRKYWIWFIVVGMFMTGCTQVNEDKKAESPKLKSEEKVETQKTNVEDKKDDNGEKSDKTDSVIESNHQTETNQTKATSKNSENITENSKQSSSLPNNQQEIISQPSTSQEQPQTDLPKQEVSKPQVTPKPEETKPVNPKPSDPKPSVPVCDNMIPSGAYPIDREAEIDAQVQAEMTENQLHGDGTFSQYKTEYGETECGTRYFYIIRIYS
ncbi:hypothetical protein [[Eubacterium] hominis]|uniref:hypothetical protein n=1 Tax=[Eubacterium] hominis TaxID=2764325 RepID=UPI003A4D93CC